ncbi:ABC transporter ATP-binding protein, partial [candidate division WOR-3 bacterium]|nr:ABC transporter ATP-binding protein [candidate division WOR-3 bacterium]
DQVEAMTLGQRIGVMKDGKLLQVADSMTLYNQPANKFVAGFIGSPPMNFLPGRIDDKTPLSFSADLFHLRLAPVLAEQLSPYQGRPVVLGVRPEGIVLGAQGHDRNPPGNSGSYPEPGLRACVEVVEHMGNEAIVYLKVGDNTLVARVPPRDAPRLGESVTVGFAPDRLHFFDAKTELALT